MVSVKHESFREEDEWRLFALPHRTNDLDRFRPRASGEIVPYLEISFPIEAVREVIIGPGAFDRADLKPRVVWNGLELGGWDSPLDSVHRLLKTQGAFGIAPRLSEIPHRR
jgi:hypothetical protein